MAAFCANCGNSLEEGMSFCINCGAGVGAEAQAAAAHEPPPPAAAAPPPPPPVVTAPHYQAPPPGAQYQYAAPPAGMDPRDAPLGTGAFIGMFLLMLIPLVNIILLLVWAFGPNANRNRKGFARASLILMLIGIIISVVIGVAVGSFVKKATNGESEWLNSIISQATDGAVDGEDIKTVGALREMRSNGDLERITSGEMSQEEVLDLLETDYGITKEQLESYLGEDMDLSQLGQFGDLSGFSMEDLESFSGTP
ncbi:MAG: zinc ribbon domain-containing protein [Syntrophomonadaceae bacterium]|nr:zinc ribbon domain-containing protein [Syntrophomonadaceae bacterium]